MASMIYVGQTAEKRVVFHVSNEPTFESHGEIYAACIGPFRTKRAALWMADPVRGQGNPHCQCVADAERLAAKYASEYDPRTGWKPLPAN